MYLRRAAVAALTTLSLFPATSYAQQLTCAPKASVTLQLKEKYGERPTYYISSSKGNMVIFLDPQDHSWTILLEEGNNLCLLADGQGWLDLRGDPV